MTAGKGWMTRTTSSRATTRRRWTSTVTSRRCGRLPRWGGREGGGPDAMMRERAPEHSVRGTSARRSAADQGPRGCMSIHRTFITQNRCVTCSSVTPPPAKICAPRSMRTAGLNTDRREAAMREERRIVCVCVFANAVIASQVLLATWGGPCGGEGAGG